MSINIVLGVYGGLSLIAAILQGRYKNIPLWSAAIMGVGGALMIGSIFMTGLVAVGMATVGCIMAHVSAIINGVKMYGHVNKTHHIVRFGLSLLVILGTYFDKMAQL